MPFRFLLPTSYSSPTQSTQGNVVNFCYDRLRDNSTIAKHFSYVRLPLKKFKERILAEAAKDNCQHAETNPQKPSTSYLQKAEKLALMRDDVTDDILGHQRTE